MPENWRETLFVWDGILSFVEQGTSSEETKDLVEDIIKWEGTWVGVDSADATKVETLKRDAFQEFVTSDNKFEVSGAAVKGEDVGTDDDVTGVKASAFYKLSLISGAGYDLEGKKHTDTVHDVYLSTLRWKGNLQDQVENVTFATGENEFGNFISVGWLRVGNRVTMARRYIEEDDVRCQWDIEDLRKAVFDQITSESETDGRSIIIPPWKCGAMHAKLNRASKRQKTKQ